MPARMLVGGSGSADFPTLHVAAAALKATSASYDNTWYPVGATLNYVGSSPVYTTVHSLVTAVPAGVTAISILKKWLRATGAAGHVLYARLRNATTETDIYTFNHTMLVGATSETEEADGTMATPIETANVSENDVIHLQVKTSSYIDEVEAAVVFAFS